ncbi:CHAP domain-containing protein [Actinacidiphila epipremni]|uniref:CHAP domain-containing protein n=1 Tax=Actinacidiphila epipremni TaxID=2053013 RepID=A0ABX0ZZC9_9ACTN|nr:CHAP domain-containing protein [Actinacidiphila epipremni]NJP48242.1 CHAP domain-containing protein [Actinacidiphila epipremni]
MSVSSTTLGRRFRRIAAQLAVVAAVVAGIAVVPALSASASVGAYVWGTDGDNLNVRASASTTAAVVASLAAGQSVTIDCQTTGPTVNGTSVWDHLPAYGGYATDAYLYTGYDGFDPGLPRCGGSTPPSGTGAAVVSTAQAQVGNGPGKYTGAAGVSSDTNWCSLFVTWVWRQNGVPAPYDIYSGDLFYWSLNRGQAHYGTSGMKPGDAVFFGDGPQPQSGSYVPSVHVGIVKSVNGNGTINTVEGNYWLGGVSQVYAPAAFDPTVPRSDVGVVYGYAHPA